MRATVTIATIKKWQHFVALTLTIFVFLPSKHNSCLAVQTIAQSQTNQITTKPALDKASESSCKPPLSQEAPSQAASQLTTIDPLAQRKSLEIYIDGLKQKIMHNWHPPYDSKAANVIVSFTVHLDGTISDILITTSSGNSKIDEIAVNTLQSLSPVEPLPPESPPNLIVDFTFDLSTTASERVEEEDAVTKRRRFWEEHRQDPKAAFEYGRALRFAGHFQEAIDKIKQAVNLGYVGSAAAIEMSSSLFRLGKPNEAEELLKQCIKDYPDCAPAHKLLGDIFFDEKIWWQAETSYHEFLRLVPEGPLSDLARMRIDLCQRHLAGEEDEE